MCLLLCVDDASKKQYTLLSKANQAKLLKNIILCSIVAEVEGGVGGRMGTGGVVARAENFAPPIIQ